MKDCPACGGSGELPFEDRFDPFSSYGHYTVGGGVCPCCKGVGEVPDDAEHQEDGSCCIPEPDDDYPEDDD